MVHLISGISTLVIAAVTAAMIAILSAFNGIETLVDELFSSIDTPWAVVPEEGAWVDAAWADSLKVLDAVAWAGGVLEQDVVVQHQGEPLVCTMLGVAPGWAGASGVEAALVDGAEFVDDTAGFPCAWLGWGIRSQLRIAPRPELPTMVTFAVPKKGAKLGRMGLGAGAAGGLGGLDAALEKQVLPVCGFFSINADFDARYVLAPLATALRLTGRDGQVSRIELLPSEPGGSSFREAAFREAIEARLGPGLKLRSRREKNALIHATHRAEKWITFSILAFIVVVAGFNILASLTLLLIEKKRDISTLWAMGMTPKAIRQIFSWQGAMINAIGAGIGLALGIGLVLAQSRYGFVQFEGAMVPAYPVELRWGDVAMVLGLVMAVGVTFSIGMVQYLVRRQELGPYAKAKSATRV